jgi:hypothetical protein
VSSERKPATEQPGLTDAELAQEEASGLPDREAMSILNLGLEDIGNFAMPINEATAINNYSNQSIAMADADQVVIIEQAAEQDSSN